MALTEFQSQKLLYLFRTFFDTDNNGTIEKSDFDLVADKVCKLRNWSAGSTQWTDMHQRLMSVWKGISAHDTDNDGHISEKEWLKLWSDVISNQQNGSWIKDYQDFMFDAQDISGDGQVDEEEYTALYTLLGVSATQCKEGFQKLTAGSDGIVTKEIFLRRFQEFISSDNESAPGNYLFGCGKF